MITRKTVWRTLCVGLVLIFGIAYRDLLLTNKVFTHDSIIWYGGYHYFVDSLARGVFPYWDPYLQGGTFFYPHVALVGLDPLLLVAAAIIRISAISPLTAYTYHHLLHFFIFSWGSYLLYKRITGCAVSSLLAAAVLSFSLAGSFFVQGGTIGLALFAPLTMYFLLLFLDHIYDRKRYIYLAAMALLAGITMTIMIPSLYLFNLTAFILVVFVFKIHDIGRTVRAFRDRKMIAAVVVSIAVVLCMAAPPLSVMFRDASGGGELFPMLRIVQKNDGMFKKIVASDITTEALSQKFTEQKGVFVSWGNLVNMVHPDLFETIPYFRDDLLAEVTGYIGIIPFIIVIVGLVFHTSRYRYLAMLMMVIIWINMFSIEGMSGKPFNMLQKAFNFVFPPLRMIEARELLGSYFQLYLCMLLALGLTRFTNQAALVPFLKKRYRFIAALCAGIVILKCVITGVYAGKLFFASAFDLYVLVQVMIFGLLVSLMRREAVSMRLFYGALAVLLIFDVYKVLGEGPKYVLMDSREHYALVDASRARNGYPFEYFKQPLVVRPNIAFGESMLKTAGVLTYGNNHSMFTTKRYYDLLTNVPIDNQLALSGVIRPVVRFFPLQRVYTVAGRSELLNFLAAADERQLADSLFVERNAGGNMPSRSEEIKPLSSYDNAPDLTPVNLIYASNSYVTRHAQDIYSARDELANNLNSPAPQIRVTDFSGNEMTAVIRNDVDGYFLYNDGWSRYWEAYDNGVKTTVYAANYNAKAVFLTAGEHKVRFVFNPVHYKMALAAYCFGFAVAVFMIGYHYVRVRRELRSVADSGPSDGDIRRPGF